MFDDKAKELLDKPKQFAIISTIEPDGQPQSSVVWYERDGEDLLISTVQDRRKHKNLVRDPRCTVLVYDMDQPYSYVEVRGHVEMTTEGAGNSSTSSRAPTRGGSATRPTTAPTTCGSSCGSSLTKSCPASSVSSWRRTWPRGSSTAGRGSAARTPSSPGRTRRTRCPTARPSRSRRKRIGTSSAD